MRFSAFDLVMALYGVLTTSYENRWGGTVGITATNLIHSDPQRVSLTITNNGATDIFISNNPAIAVNDGIRVTAGGGVIVMSYDRDFTYQTQQFFAISTIANNDIFVVENCII